MQLVEFLGNYQWSRLLLPLWDHRRPFLKAVVSPIFQSNTVFNYLYGKFKDFLITERVSCAMNCRGVRSYAAGENLVHLGKISAQSFIFSVPFIESNTPFKKSKVSRNCI
jgi:hypothetical protein